MLLILFLVPVKCSKYTTGSPHRRVIPMLQHLFATTTRYTLLRVLIFNPEHRYSIAELQRKLHISPASARAELRRLEQIGLVIIEEEKGQQQYRVNAEAIIFPELRALFLKAQLLTEYDFGNKIQSIGHVLYAVLTGYFTNIKEAKTDIFIVGTVNRSKLRRIVRHFQRDLDHDLRYTVMSKKEYQYRNEITDRFLYDILENRKILLVDKLKR